MADTNRIPNTSWSQGFSGTRTKVPGSPADFGNAVIADTEKWSKVVKFAGSSWNNSQRHSTLNGRSQMFAYR
jgi:hypothetical protein